MENQVRFNSRRSKDYRGCLNWYFLILNKSEEEILRIGRQIYGLFAPIINENISYKGQLQNKVYYNLINFESAIRPDFSKAKIFKKLYKDNNLYRREEDVDGLANYVADIDLKIKD